MSRPSDPDYADGYDYGTEGQGNRMADAIDGFTGAISEGPEYNFAPDAKMWLKELYDAAEYWREGAG